MASKKRRRNEQAPGWAWMLVGLSIGLAVALVVYLRSGVELPDSAAPPQSARTGTPSPETPVSGTVTAETIAAETAPDRTADADTNANPDPDADAAPDPEYAFYRLLQELEVNVPESERASLPPREFVIQAGSFSTFEEADRRRARLALLGIESNIERAIVGNDIWHRVIIGPLSERAEINRVMRQLNAERIDSMPPRPVSN